MVVDINHLLFSYLQIWRKLTPVGDLEKLYLLLQYWRGKWEIWYIFSRKS